mmetsp:Transcript_27703/g.76236  ORF Transcript_27703/g.76236 Transcript_27703/m.76236 type:complete len:259 (+) Transcript_27703:111-887(+)
MKSWLWLAAGIVLAWPVSGVESLRNECGNKECGNKGSSCALSKGTVAYSLNRRRGGIRSGQYISKFVVRHPAFRGGGGSGLSSWTLPGWTAYNKALDNTPLMTKALTSLVGWAIGDLLAQLFLSKGPFDAKRFINLALFGLTYFGPAGHYFYNFLDAQIPGTNSRIVAIKILVDQLIWTPFFLAIFFAYVGVTKGNSLAMVQRKLERDLFAACQASWRVWPLVHAVNYKFISTKHRLIFVNSMQVAFNIFLSIIGFRQ